MRKTIITIITTLLFIGIIVSIKSIYSKTAKQKSEIEYKNPKHDFQRITEIPMPLHINFAGEEVPLQYFDIRERLEKELAINVFWHSSTFLNIKRANRYLPYISQILEEEGLPDDLKYIPLIESGLTNAVSPSKAVGFWQFLEGTALEFGLEVNKEVDERYNWKKSTKAACKYYKWLYEKFDSWTLSAAAFNCGRTTLNRQMDTQQNEKYYSLLLPDETERYIFRALAFKLILNNPERYGFYLEYNELYPSIKTKEVRITETIENLAIWAKGKGLTYRELKYFNPWLRSNKLTIASGKEYIIEIPNTHYRISN